jgi:hypothetical protein
MFLLSSMDGLMRPTSLTSLNLFMQLLLFGGHGTGGWLSRYDVYYNDTIILDRVTAQWKRLPIGNEPPPPRAYHTMTCIGARHLLIGGFDGKLTFGDLWWLVPEGISFLIVLMLYLKKLTN